jgi:hypothetical protein
VCSYHVHYLTLSHRFEVTESEVSSEEEWCSGSHSGSDEELDDSYSDEGIDEHSEPPKKRARLRKVSMVELSRDRSKQVSKNLPPKSNSESQSKTITNVIVGSKHFPVASALSPLVNTPSSEAKLSSRPQLSACKEKVDTDVSGVVGFGSHEHHSWKFLVERTDKSGYSPEHPQFDSRTIKIPLSVLQQQTPAMRQWFELKSDNFDTILFFKVFVRLNDTRQADHEHRWGNSMSYFTWMPMLA